ncbi:four helix bundle protein [Mangrovibacterium lignilyticum]|uniref:four helix bundle protein n=1 Tax=Mangrovibacterium lignilyticum TaxID=2668052 RepID=UPI0013D28C4A|nr:four helix bundle protein [Mangrovibacterium lignilyticum]
MQNQYQYPFEKLDVWQLSIKLAKMVYQTSIRFPETEKFGLTNQIRRASVSISSNIAEGSARTSSKNQARFYEIAFGSLMEVTSQLILAVELEYISKETNEDFRPKIDEIANKLNALRNSCFR